MSLQSGLGWTVSAKVAGRISVSGLCSASSASCRRHLSSLSQRQHQPVTAGATAGWRHPQGLQDTLTGGALQRYNITDYTAVLHTSYRTFLLFILLTT